MSLENKNEAFPRKESPVSQPLPLDELNVPLTRVELLGILEEHRQAIVRDVLAALDEREGRTGHERVQVGEKIIYNDQPRDPSKPYVESVRLPGYQRKK